MKKKKKIEKMRRKIIPAEETKLEVLFFFFLNAALQNTLQGFKKNIKADEVPTKRQKKSEQLSSNYE